MFVFGEKERGGGGGAEGKGNGTGGVAVSRYPLSWIEKNIQVRFFFYNKLSSI